MCGKIQVWLVGSGWLVDWSILYKCEKILVGWLVGWLIGLYSMVWEDTG